MKTYHVYELVNSQGAVEYVGRTTKPNARMYDHTKRKPAPGQGMFYGRTDISMAIVKTFTNSREAGRYEGELKLSYGFEWTESEVGKRAGKLNGKLPNYTGRKLDYEKAQYIRTQYAKKVDVFGNRITQDRLAKAFGISVSKINNLLNNKTYTTP